MAAINWGMLAKSQVDPETIEQAIARLILEHNENEEAHLGAGQSLQSHKAAVIIDHLASSIIADKIKDFEVLPNHLADFGSWRVIAVTFEGSNGWEIFYSGNYSRTFYCGFLALSAGSTINSWLWTDVLGFNPPGNKEFYYRFGFTSQVITGTFANVLSYIGMGQMIGSGPYHGIYFKISAAKLYACHRASDGVNSVEYATEIVGFNIVDSQEYQFMFHYLPGEKIEFYIDQVLFATHTENLPNTAIKFSAPLNYYIKTLDAGLKFIYISSPYFTQKF